MSGARWREQAAPRSATDCRHPDASESSPKWRSLKTGPPHCSRQWITPERELAMRIYVLFMLLRSVDRSDYDFRIRHDRPGRIHYHAPQGGGCALADYCDRTSKQDRKVQSASLHVHRIPETDLESNLPFRSANADQPKGGARRIFLATVLESCAGGGLEGRLG